MGEPALGDVLPLPGARLAFGGVVVELASPVDQGSGGLEKAGHGPARPQVPLVGPGVHDGGVWLVLQLGQEGVEAGDVVDVALVGQELKGVVVGALDDLARDRPGEALRQPLAADGSAGRRRGPSGAYLADRDLIAIAAASMTRAWASGGANLSQRSAEHVLAIARCRACPRTRSEPEPGR